MDAGRLLRAVRRARTLSQRELAELCGVPRSTIDRIESGATDPRMGTTARILDPAGFRLVVLDDAGRLLEPDDAHDRLRDAALRRLPAHLRARRITDDLTPWWGWGRIAWWPDDPAVPAWTYDRRPDRVRRPWLPVYRWDDAT